MPDLIIENVPDKLLERLRRSAERHRRSLNAEVIERLEASAPTSRAEPRARIDPQAFLAELRELHARLKHVPPLTDEFLERAINEGRE